MTATGSSSSDPPLPCDDTGTAQESSSDPAIAELRAPQQAAGSSPPLHVVLYQPQIPQNTGNIARTCVALGAKLWIVRPTAFRLDSSQLKRAGLDYWQYLQWEMVDSWSDLLDRFDNPQLWLISKFGQRAYYDTSFAKGDILVLGRETNGLPESLRQEYAQRQICIPMPGQVRSLNQANAAAIVAYEAARQIGLFITPVAPSEAIS